MATDSRTWIEISSAALRHNLRITQDLIGPGVGIMPIVKGNAYGHGLTQVAKVLGNENITALGVAHGEEALALRALKSRGRIVVLSSWTKAELPELLGKNIEVVVWDFQSLNFLKRIVETKQLKANIHLKLDTGTTRIGFLPEQVEKLKKQYLPATIKVVGIFSHFANAEEASQVRTKAQLKYFTTLTQNGSWAEQGTSRHIACTAALLRYPEARFGLVRLGIGFYGLWSSAALKRWVQTHHPRFRLQPALAWKTKLLQVKKVARGTAVGYGSTYRVRRPTLVGIVPIGYADGYDRRLSNRGWMIIRGQRAPVIGRVCMNLTMIDVTAMAGRPGEVVSVFGPGSTFDDAATITNTIHYELVTKLNPTIERRLL